MIRKAARDLVSGDIIHTDAGERIGIVITDPYVYGWSGLVEFQVQLDDRIEEKCTGILREYEVIEWQPSQAV